MLLVLRRHLFESCFSEMRLVCKGLSGDFADGLFQVYDDRLAAIKPRSPGTSNQCDTKY